MIHYDRQMRARGAVILLFAILSGLSATATAVLPAIVHA